MDVICCENTQERFDRNKLLFLKSQYADRSQNWNHRNHFIATAAEAMRRILVERARRKKRVKHGGDWARVQFDPQIIGEENSRTDLVELD